MRYAIEYRRKFGNTKPVVKTTFITKETEIDLVIHQFENMHNRQLTVISAEPRPLTETPKQPTTNWQLNRVDDIEHTQDNSGIIVYVNWDLQTSSCRLDIVAIVGGFPLQSFAGTAENVRKHTIRYLDKSWQGVSLEHASYIGAELARCEAETIDFVQS